MTSRRPVPALALAVTLVLLLGGCGFLHKGADAREAADKLAAGLQKGDVTGIRFTDAAAPAQYAALAKTLDYPAKVSVDQVTRSGDSADVRLSWTVDLGGQTWKHQTHARLLDQHGTWRVAWKPSILEKSLVAGETFQVARVKAERGNILGRDDQPIVTQRPVIRFGIDRAQVPATAAPDSARRLAALVGVDPAAYATQVTKAGPKAFVQAIAMRRDGVPERLLAGVEKVP